MSCRVAKKVDEVDEEFSEPMLISIILKSVTGDFYKFVTKCKFRKVEHNLDSAKLDLVNCEYDKRQRRNVECAESAFVGNNRQETKLKCNFCGKISHKVAFVLQKNLSKEVLIVINVVI